MFRSGQLKVWCDEIYQGYVLYIVITLVIHLFFILLLHPIQDINQNETVIPCARDVLDAKVRVTHQRLQKPRGFFAKRLIFYCDC